MGLTRQYNAAAVPQQGFVVTCQWEKVWPEGLSAKMAAVALMTMANMMPAWAQASTTQPPRDRMLNIVLRGPAWYSPANRMSHS